MERGRKVFEEEDWYERKPKVRERKFSMGKLNESPPKTERYSK